MEWQTAWGLQDKFTLKEAILLTCEVNPSEAKIKDGSRALPETYEPLLKKLIQWRKENPSKNEGGVSISWGDQRKSEKETISRTHFMEWLQILELKPTTFFANAKPIGYRAYLDKSHPHYSKKLAAAVLAWEALADEPANLGKTTPKTAAIDWIVKNKVEVGLAANSKSEVNNATLDQIGRIVNWSDEGGPARTKSRKNCL